MSVKIEEVKNNINKALTDSSKPWTKFFDFAEMKTNVPRIYIFGGVFAFTVLYLVFGYAAEILCNGIGVAYPAYVSIKAIESSSKADDTKWLIYWVTYAILSVIELFSVFLTNVIPFYWLIKCVFLIWCMAPIENNGSVFLYTKWIRPYFLKHQSAADAAIDNLSNKAKKLAGDISSKLTKDD